MQKNRFSHDVAQLKSIYRGIDKKGFSDKNLDRNLTAELQKALKSNQRIFNTVKFLNFRMPENFAVIYLIFKKRGQTFGYSVKKMQME